MPSSRPSTLRRRSSAKGSPSSSPGRAPRVSQSKAPSLGLAPLVIDIGSHSIKIARASIPQQSSHNADNSSSLIPSTSNELLLLCPNAIVRPRTASSSLLIGPHIDQKCLNFGSLALRFPMERGMVVDWPAQKLILDVAIAEALRLEAAQEAGSTSAATHLGNSRRLLEDRTVIITESPFNFPELQNALDLVFIEEYGVGNIWRCSAAQLVPFAPKLFLQEKFSSRSKKFPSTNARPECCLIVDVGHGGTHVLPMVRDEVIWSAVRRQRFSQRLLTNLLKETLSFRQWDMMDEGWLVGHIKEQCCFVASKAGRRGESFAEDLSKDKERPSEWSYAKLVEICQSRSRRRNPITQEYILPDYSTTSKEARLGYVKGERELKTELRASKKARVDRDAAVEVDGDSREEDEFVARLFFKPGGRRSAALGNDREEEMEEDEEKDEEEDEEDEDDDDDFDEEAEEGIRKKSSTKRKRPKKTEEEDEEEQELLLERERFQVPEVMFNPGMLDSESAPLHEVIEDAINACSEEVRGIMWANIVLVGGGGKLRGLRRRLENELRMLAPQEAPLHIHLPDDPVAAAALGGQAILSASQGSQLGRFLRSHLLTSAEWSSEDARKRFGSWCSSFTL